MTGFPQHYDFIMRKKTAFSTYGIIVYDGDLLPFDDEIRNRDYDSFTPLGPSRFYMQTGDELWFDLASDFWRFEE